ncbi:MAG: rhodanese-like domain-containing protein [Tenacibaculum sp.]
MYKLTFSLFLIAFSINAQQNLKELLKQHNSESIPYITVDELVKEKSSFVLLDAREKQEYKVSRIENAIFVGYDGFNLKKTTLALKDKNRKIIVYCSLGVRSEDIAEQLKQVGYTNVYNLYGGIFEWKNRGNKVIDKKGIETQKVHAFSKEWSKWLVKGKKVY